MKILDHVSGRVNNFFPATEECVSTYQKLSGAWYAVAGACIEQTFNEIDHGTVASNPKEFAAMLALGAVTAGTGTFFYNRSWQSQGE